MLISFVLGVVFWSLWLLVVVVGCLVMMLLMCVLWLFIDSVLVLMDVGRLMM